MVDERSHRHGGGLALSKRKTTGRITVEEVDALFQRPLRLLHPRAKAVEPSPIPPEDAFGADETPRNRDAVQSTDAEFERGTTSTSHSSPSNGSAAYRGRWRDWLQSAAKHLALRTADGASQRFAATETASASALAARLEENLLEASCLAAELQRRHREAQAEYERAVHELRNLTALLVDQLEPASRQQISGKANH